MLLPILSIMVNRSTATIPKILMHFGCSSSFTKTKKCTAHASFSRLTQVNLDRSNKNQSGPMGQKNQHSWIIRIKGKHQHSPPDHNTGESIIQSHTRVLPVDYYDNHLRRQLLLLFLLSRELGCSESSTDGSTGWPPRDLIKHLVLLACSCIAS